MFNEADVDLFSLLETVVNHFKNIGIVFFGGGSECAYWYKA